MKPLIIPTPAPAGPITVSTVPHNSQHMPPLRQFTSAIPSKNGTTAASVTATTSKALASGKTKSSAQPIVKLPSKIVKDSSVAIKKDDKKLSSQINEKMPSLSSSPIPRKNASSSSSAQLKEVPKVTFYPQSSTASSSLPTTATSDIPSKQQQSLPTKSNNYIGIAKNETTKENNSAKNEKNQSTQMSMNRNTHNIPLAMSHRNNAKKSKTPHASAVASATASAVDIATYDKKTANSIGNNIYNPNSTNVSFNMSNQERHNLPQSYMAQQHQQQIPIPTAVNSQPNLIPNPLINSDMKQIISNILQLLQTYGPLTVDQIEYNLPPYSTLDFPNSPSPPMTTIPSVAAAAASSTTTTTSGSLPSIAPECRFKFIHDVLEVLTVIQVIHKTKIPIGESISSFSSSATTANQGTATEATVSTSLGEKMTVKTLSSIPEKNNGTGDNTNSYKDNNSCIENDNSSYRQKQQQIPERNEKIVYFFHDGKVRGDVVFPWEIMDMIQDANKEINETADRINLLKKELGIVGTDANNIDVPQKEQTIVRSGRKRKIDKLTAASIATEEPITINPIIATAIPPSQRIKATREFLKVILLKYPDLVNDPVYNAALRNFNVDLGAVARERERYSNFLSNVGVKGSPTSLKMNNGKSGGNQASSSKKRQSSSGQVSGKKKRSRKTSLSKSATVNGAVTTSVAAMNKEPSNSPNGEIKVNMKADQLKIDTNVRTPTNSSVHEPIIRASNPIQRSTPVPQAENKVIEKPSSSKTNEMGSFVEEKKCITMVEGRDESVTKT